MYSLISSLIIDSIKDSSVLINKYDAIPEKYYKIRDIINDNISVLCFFLKNYYANIVTADREQIKTHIIALIDKYYNPTIIDIEDIFNLVIEHQDFEMFDILFQKYYKFIKNEDKFFYQMFKHNSFKILKYYLDNTNQNFWAKFIDNLDKICWLPIHKFQELFNILKHNRLTIDLNINTRHIQDDYDNHVYGYYIYKSNKFINHIISYLENANSDITYLIMKSIYLSNDIEVYKLYLIYICKIYRVDLLRDFIKRKKYFFTNYFDISFFEYINDKLYTQKLEEYEYQNHDEISFNKHKYVSASIININKLLLPYVDTPSNFDMLAHHYRDNLHSIVTLQHGVQLLKKINKFNLDFTQTDSQNFFVIQDLFRYGTYDTVTYVMRKYKPSFLSYFNQTHKLELLESIVITCNNNDARILKVYLDFLDELYPYNEIVDYICKSLNKCPCIDNTKFFTKIKLFKKKVNILINFIDNANIQQKNDFFTILLFLTIDNNSYYATKFILGHQFKVTNFYNYYSKFIYGKNDYKNKKLKINKINREIISKFEFNNDFINYYKFAVENIIQNHCYCQLSMILNYIWRKLTPQQIVKCQKKYLKHTENNLTSYYSTNILKLFENSNSCSCCNSEKPKNEFYKKIIKLYKKILGKKENDIVYIFNYINSWYQGTTESFKWEYFRILYLNGFHHKYDFDSPSEIIEYLQSSKTKYKEDKKYNSNYLDCILKIIDFQLCIQYLRQKYLNKYNKSVTNFKNTIQNINNEFKYTPICDDKLPISSMIGFEFKKNMANICRKNPIHITPNHLLDTQINQKYIYFTEKADGLTKVGLPPNIFPNIDCIDNHQNFEFDLDNIEYEYIPSLNMCVVFNVYHTDKSLVENLIYLRYIHPYVPNYHSDFFTTTKYQKYTPEYINKFKQYEKECFEKYILDNKNTGRIMWWPKMIFTYNNENIIDYLYNIHEITSQNLDIFPTDGWVLYSKNPEDDILKIKPYKHLTIDLKYNSNNIWKTYNKDCINVINDENIDLVAGNIHRCYYSETLQNWVARELRSDKKHPNNSEICNYITLCHQTKWSIGDIITLYKNKPYYMLTQKHQKSNKLYKYDINQIIKLIGHKSVLDLGCGYKAKTLQEKIPGNYIGLDSDIHIATIKNVYTFDMCHLWSNQIQGFVSIYPYLKSLPSLPSLKFEIILCLNSIHYAFKTSESINNFKENLEYFSNQGSILIIRYLNSNKIANLFDDKGIINDSNGSFIRDNRETLTIYYNWVHSKPIIEQKITLNKLQKTLSFDWNYQDILSNQLNRIKSVDNNKSAWNQYFESFDYAVFLRI